MRELKFRAWDGKNKAMIHQEDEDYYFEYTSDGFILIGIYQGPDLPYTEEIKDAVIMQFTGLIDRNGVEIFESDILFWDGSIVGEVTYLNAEYITGKGVSARALCNAPDDIEVIGNIYQHPHLLKPE